MYNWRLIKLKLYLSSNHEYRSKLRPGYFIIPNKTVKYPQKMESQSINIAHMKMYDVSLSTTSTLPLRFIVISSVCHPGNFGTDIGTDILRNDVILTRTQLTISVIHETHDSQTHTLDTGGSDNTLTHTPKNRSSITETLRNYNQRTEIHVYSRRGTSAE